MSDRPPHFPDPSADPTAILSARIVELEEINAAQYAELAWYRDKWTEATKALAQHRYDGAVAQNARLAAKRSGEPT